MRGVGGADGDPGPGRRFCVGEAAPKYRDESSDIWLWRKEVERIGNEGKFGWGAGTSIVPSLRELLKVTDAPQVLFSQTQDGGDDQPGGITVWRGAKDIMEEPGREVELPRFFTETGPPPGSPWYAMILSSNTPLIPLRTDGPVLYHTQLRNLRTDRQITLQNPLAVVRRVGEPAPGDTTDYPVLFAATLVYPYFVEMTDPING